ncbi:MAG TPA: hypothetical protein VFW23_02745 [Tepidisphaeraceae bacterium]|nr:hypothetical protein [Tepidisphaeraceae bacterium]
MTDLGTLGGGTFSEGYGINDAGQVVGEAYDSNILAHAFIYTNGTMQDLNLLIDPNSGWQLGFAYGINDAGQITGYGQLDGENHAFLLTPTPEPGACAVALVAALGLLRRRRDSNKILPRV